MKHVSKLKLNAKGFAHIELVMLVVTIAVIGGIGSYVMLKRSHAATITQSQCVNTYHGVWLDLTSKGINHSPCWSTPGAYLVNYGTGGIHVDQVPASGNNPETGNNQSLRYDYPNYIIVVSKTWKICKDITGPDLPCTNPSFNPITYGATNLCNPLSAYRKTEDKDGGVYFDTKFCSLSNIYIQRTT